MELREIRAFVVLADELHFTRTAARLRVAQSAVSYAIKNLESELGAALFVRNKRKVTLTPAGEMFRTHATRALQEFEQGARAVQRMAAGLAGKLVLRFTLMSTLTVVPRAIARFQREYPELQVDALPGGSVQQLESIRLGACDIGFMPFKRNVEPLATEVVQRSPLVVLMAHNHALARRKSLRLEQLSAEKFVFLKPSDEPQVLDLFRSRCVAAGFAPNIVLAIDQLEVLLAMVAAGVGVSCVPKLVTNLRFPNMVAIPLVPGVLGGISAVWDPRTLSAAGKNFLAILRDERAASER